METVEADTNFRAPALDEFRLLSPVEVAIVPLVPILLIDFLESVSTDTMRGLGCWSGAMSTVSTNCTCRSQVVVGDMVVGRVNVEVIIYEIVPRSN